MSADPRAVEAVAQDETLPLGAPCANCGARLAGPYCHICGQRADDYHRSFLKLTSDAIEGLVSYDSRVWTTLRRLAFDPVGLTRDYLAGRRAPQMPPFRLFLYVIVLIFFVGAATRGATPRVVTTEAPQLHAAPGLVLGVNEAQPGDRAAEWWNRAVRAANARPEAFSDSFDTWGHRMAVLTLPFAAGTLSLFFIGRRDLRLFDHLIFAMHSIAFQGIAISGLMALGQLTPWVWLLAIAIPIHFFIHLRGVYEIGVAGTLLRMGGLLVCGAVTILALAVALVVIGLYEVGGAG